MTGALHVLTEGYEMAGGVLGMAGETVAGWKADTLWKVAGAALAAVAGLFLNGMYQQSVENGRSIVAMTTSTNRELAELSGKMEGLAGLGGVISTIETRLRVVEGDEQQVQGIVKGINDRLAVHRAELNALRDQLSALTRDMYANDLRRQQDWTPNAPRAGQQR